VSVLLSPVGILVGLIVLVVVLIALVAITDARADDPEPDLFDAPIHVRRVERPFDWENEE
jgi:hypothetical protein